MQKEIESSKKKIKAFFNCYTMGAENDAGFLKCM